ncbi:MAG: CDP-alcohol phosphatidyltransferase family protein [Anaerolineae bacterium]|jgi:CDP-diacylglycerol--glycerol-3-phosphate 3-phosphatidyltransferase
MANLVSISRLLLVGLVIWIAYQPPSYWQLTAVPILIIAFVTDALDGYLARSREEASVFGAMLDIAVDRIVELSLWVVLVDLKLVGVWVPLVFIVRGSLVDAIRAGESSRQGVAPFDTVASQFGRWLVKSQFMRVFYAALKAVAFCWLLLILPFPSLFPDFWGDWAWLLEGIGAVLVWATVLICLARGLPVTVEALARQRQVDGQA